jgi:hypothetical protein
MTSFQWTKGHSRTLGNEQSDQLAKQGAEKPDVDLFSLEIPKEFDLQGVKLATITQATAYQGIREGKDCPPRPTTTQNLQLARTALETYNGNLETDETLWLGTRNRNLRPRIQQFLYKSLHGTQKIGDFWKHVQNFETRQLCTTCTTSPTIETMEHILTSCAATPTEEIWKLAENTWPHARHLWPEISIGLILGCGSIAPPKPEPRPDDGANQDRGHIPKGATRLLQILLSEAAYLIWVLRCERVIQVRTHSTSEIRTRWLNAINTRLTDDKLTATRIKRGKKSTQTTINTWEHVLRKQMDLPQGWIASREVLVGRRTRRALPP